MPTVGHRERIDHRRLVEAHELAERGSPTERTRRRRTEEAQARRGSNTETGRDVDAERHRRHEGFAADTPHALGACNGHRQYYRHRMHDRFLV